MSHGLHLFETTLVAFQPCPIDQAAVSPEKLGTALCPVLVCTSPCYICRCTVYTGNTCPRERRIRALLQSIRHMVDRPHCRLTRSVALYRDSDLSVSALQHSSRATNSSIVLAYWRVSGPVEPIYQPCPSRVGNLPPMHLWRTSREAARLSAVSTVSLSTSSYQTPRAWKTGYSHSTNSPPHPAYSSFDLPQMARQ